MRAVSPLGREVVCHIKSPFLLLLQLHSKHGDRGRDCAWQHYSQASRKIAVLLPISVTVIQVQPALCDAWYVYRPRGLLKQSGLSLLCCSFLFCHLFSFMLPGWFKHALGEFFFSFSEGDGWHRRPRQRIQHGALPGSELWQTEGGQRRRRSPATETKETILAWVSLSVISITVTKICFSQLARHTQSTQLQHIQSSQSPHLTHVWLSCLCKPACYWHSFISRFIALRVPSCWANRRKQVWLQFCTTRPQSMTPDGRENKHWVLLLII